MIKIVKGDLFESGANIIGHQVNCQGKMGSGVAEQVKRKYPKAYEEYYEIVKAMMAGEQDLRHDLLGRVNGVQVAPRLWIANMFGQNKYGYDGKKYTDTEALFKCFRTVRSMAEKNNLTVALPHMIGCYRGGADWKEVEDLLLTAFDGYEVTLYKYHEG